MASSAASRCLLLALFIVFSSAYGQLSPTFYASSCRNLETIVRNVMNQVIIVNNNRRMGASLLRLFFHDCFVQGCDASVLLDDVPGIFTGEKTAFPNNNSLLGFDVIDQIKNNVEIICPGVVSCADIVALAARDGTVLLGGPTWTVPLGRRDSTTASWSTANSDLPNPASDLGTLAAAFAKKGLNATDMTVLSGAHTIGFSQCKTYRPHIYGDANIDPTYAAALKTTCPAAAGVNDTILSPLDARTTGLVFDNNYYVNLVAKRALIRSDQALFNGGSQDSLVQYYSISSNKNAFFANFTTAMIKMGNITPLTGKAGQIRANCRVVNH